MTFFSTIRSVSPTAWRLVSCVATQVLPLSLLYPPAVEPAGLKHFFRAIMACPLSVLWWVNLRIGHHLTNNDCSLA
jgi:hypothetical protein